MSKDHNAVHLEVAHVRVNVVHVLSHEQRVVGLLVVDVLDARGQRGPCGGAWQVDVHGADIAVGLCGPHGGGQRNGERGHSCGQANCLRLELALHGKLLGIVLVADAAEDLAASFLRLCNGLGAHVK